MDRYILLLLLFATCSFGQDSYWRDSNGKPVPDTASRQTVNGVGAWLLLTADDDWQEKWNTPSTNIPQFSEAKPLAIGDHAYALLLLAGPGRSDSGDADVTCDVEVQHPDGSISSKQQGIACLNENLIGPSKSLYLSRAVIKFVRDKDDLSGTWIVRETVTDKIRHAVIHVTASFTMK